MALPPPELDVRTPIDTIQPQSEDLISDTEGLFDFIIKSLKTLADLSDSNTAGWNALAGKMAECKVKWDAWYAGFVDREQFLQKEEQWNGNGRYSYLYLTRTATKLCDALSERKNALKRHYE